LRSGNQMRTSILGIIVSAAVGSFAFFGVASPAYALSVVILGVGQWGPDVTPVQGFSEPGATFAFESCLRIRFPLIQPRVAISIMY
jgi:hypothetical protein